MGLRIEPADFDDPALVVFLQAHLDELRPTTPEESRHALDLPALRDPAVRLRVAHDDGEIVGCGALAGLGPGHEELKSMRVAPHRRGQGIGAALLVHLVEDARGRGIGRLSLETGSMPFFAPARALYARAGFTPCPPFGSYLPDPNSVFLTMAVAAAPDIDPRPASRGWQ